MGDTVNFDCFDSETESGLQRSATIKQPSMTQALADPGITGSGKPPAEGNGAGTVRTMFPARLYSLGQCCHCRKVHGAEGKEELTVDFNHIWEVGEEQCQLLPGQQALLPHPLVEEEVKDSEDA